MSRAEDDAIAAAMAEVTAGRASGIDRAELRALVADVWPLLRLAEASKGAARNRMTIARAKAALALLDRRLA